MCVKWSTCSTSIFQFARGCDPGEDAEAADLGKVVTEAALAAANARAAGIERIRIDVPAGVRLAVKRNALKRCATDLIDDALKPGSHVNVVLAHNSRFVRILIDDSGPGITEACAKRLSGRSIAWMKGATSRPAG